MNFGKPLLSLTEESISKFISPSDVYQYYLGDKYKSNKAFSSPFRQDKNPSFIIGRNMRYMDFATGESGNCFSFVQKLYSLEYHETLLQIIYDLGYSNKFSITSSRVDNVKQLSTINSGKKHKVFGIDIQVKIRDFKEHDIQFWNCYGISLKYLTLGKVYAISHFFINNKPYVAEKYAYAYLEEKDDKKTFKIYQPYSIRKKWLNNNNFSVWELWHLLPAEHERLIITSSRKDALSIIENIKVPSTSLQAETVKPKQKVMQELLRRFKKVYILYDNDYTKAINLGQQQALKHATEYDLTNVCIPKEYKSKDFSDLVCNYGRVYAVEILKDLL